MLRKPVPTGVVIGAFRAQRVRLTLSITASGSGVPVRAITSMPASCTSQLIFDAGGVDALAGRLGQLGSRAVAGYQSYVVRHIVSPARPAGYPRI